MSVFARRFPDCLDLSLIIQFKAVGPERDIIYRIGKHDSIKLFLRSYAEQSGLPLDDHYFVLRGQHIDADLTVEQVGIVHDDAIEVVEKRNGILDRAVAYMSPRPFPPEPPTLLGYPAEFADLQLRYEPDDPRRGRRLARLTARAARAPKDRVPVANPVNNSPSSAAAAAEPASPQGGRRSVGVSESRSSSSLSSVESVSLGEPEEPAWKRVHLDELLDERTGRDLAEAKVRDLEQVVADLQRQLDQKEAARLQLQREVIRQKRRAEYAERELEELRQ